MTANKLVVTLALLLSATSAAFAQSRQSFGMYGDRPYYDSDSSGWLDYEYHPGIDYAVTPPTAPAGIQNSKVTVRQSSHSKVTARENGLHAFAMVPGGSSSTDPNHPALTGGGSLGYNQNLYNF
jgi:hypothetical protein